MFPSPRLFEYGNEVIHEPEVLSNIKKIASDGRGCTMALLWDGRLFATGNNQYSQYGNGTTQTDANSNYTKWTFVRDNVDDVCCNNLSIAGTFVIRQGNELYYTGSKTPITGDDGAVTVLRWALLQDVSSLLTEVDDYIKEIICGYRSVLVLIRNERLGTGKVYARGESRYLGIGINKTDYTKFQLSTTAPDNVIKLSNEWSYAGVFILTADNILLGVGYQTTSTNQIDNTGVTLYSYTQVDTEVYNMQCCGDFIMYLKSDGIYRRGSTTSAGLPGAITTKSKVTSLDIQDVSLLSKILLSFISTYNCALSIPAGVLCTAPTAVGVNWGNSSNNQFTIIPGTENKEVQELVGGVRTCFFRSGSDWYVYSSITSQKMPPNVNGVIIVPD